MPTKSALIIGNCDYNDAKLSNLICPSTDVDSFASLLKDPKFGGFDSVISMLNAPKASVERAVAHLFQDKSREDLVLMYFSGHGLRDDNGDLYLATQDTEFQYLEFTSLAAAFVKKMMDRSYSRRQVLILDCCHSGAFSAGFKGAKAEVIGSSAGTKSAFDSDGYGRVILAASDATQYAWEGEMVIGQPSHSVYTRFLLEGIQTGEADLDYDGAITVDELHRYLHDRTQHANSKQRPTWLGDRVQGSLVLSRAPQRSAQLPPELDSALQSPFVGVREGALNELVDIFKVGSVGLAAASLQALAKLTNDDSNRIRRKAIEAIQDCRAARNDIKQLELSEIHTNLSNTQLVSPTLSEQLIAEQPTSQERAVQQVSSEIIKVHDSSSEELPAKEAVDHEHTGIQPGRSRNLGGTSSPWGGQLVPIESSTSLAPEIVPKLSTEIAASLQRVAEARTLLQTSKESRPSNPSGPTQNSLSTKVPDESADEALAAVEAALNRSKQLQGTGIKFAQDETFRMSPAVVISAVLICVVIGIIVVTWMNN